MLNGIKIEKHDLENATKILEYTPKKVYIPLVNPKGVLLKATVEEKSIVEIGTVLAVRDDFNLPIVSSVSGTVDGYEDRYYPPLKKTIKHLVISVSEQQKEEKLDILSADSTKEQIIENIRKAGIVGLGGAGFPTHFKYQTAKDIDTILINGAECEPFLSTDYAMMQNDIDLLFKGIQLMIKAADAKKAVIGVKNYKIHLIEMLEKECTKYGNVTVAKLENIYPIGGEKTLIKFIFNKEIDKLPSEQHIIVNNAQTAIAIARSCLLGEHLTHKVVTFSGDGLVSQANVRCPIGTPIDEIVSLLGGYADDKIHLILGGPMTGTSLNTDKVSIFCNTNGVTVLKHKEYLTNNCLRCGRCSDHCTANLQPVEIKDAVKNRNIEKLMKLDVMKCVECGLCSYICPSRIEVADYVKKAKPLVRFEMQKQANNGGKK